MSVFEKVREMILELGLVDESQIKPESNLEGLGIDSLDAVELIMKCEDEFDISIDDEVAEKFKTVQDLVKHIEGRTSCQ